MCLFQENYLLNTVIPLRVLTVTLLISLPEIACDIYSYDSRRKSQGINLSKAARRPGTPGPLPGRSYNSQDKDALLPTPQQLGVAVGGWSLGKAVNSTAAVIGVLGKL